MARARHSITLPTIDVNAIDVPTIGIDPMREV